MKLPELKPEDVTVLIDSREQLPFDVTPLRSEVATLPSGDYSVKGCESVIALERKSLPDLICCVGRERSRFDRETQRLAAYPVRALIVEASWADIERGEWRGAVTPQAALGSLLGWIAGGLPVLMAGDRERAQVYASRLLFLAARREWRKLRTMATAVEVEPKAKPKLSRNAPRGPATSFAIIDADETN